MMMIIIIILKQIAILVVQLQHILPFQTYMITNSGSLAHSCQVRASSLPTAHFPKPHEYPAARENLSSSAVFWDPLHMSEDAPLSTDPSGSPFTAPSSIPCFQLMTAASTLAHALHPKEFPAQVQGTLPPLTPDTQKTCL